MRFTLSLGILIVASAIASAQLHVPQLASPRGSVSADLGVTTVSVDYGRPSVNGRVVWGDLVPYDQIWRAGANENTVFTTSNNVSINGKPLAAGSYGLHMIPGKTEWTIIFNTDHKAWGSYFYNRANDALTVSVTPSSGPHTEMLTYAVPQAKGGEATFQLQWENMVVPFTVSVDLVETITEDLRQQLSGLAGFTPTNYAQAATWVLQNNGNMDLAEKWAARALQGTPDFQSLMLSSMIAEKKGNQNEASEYADRAMKVANIADVNNYGYRLLQQGKVEQAISIFKINTERNPKDANSWDSLGEGYASAKQNAKAIECFKKSLSLNPPDATRQNSEMWLKKLQ